MGGILAIKAAAHVLRSTLRLRMNPERSHGPLAHPGACGVYAGSPRRHERVKGFRV